MPTRLRGARRDAAALSTTCVYVGPRSWYANPFRVGDPGPSLQSIPMDSAETVDLFAEMLRGAVGRFYATRFARDLRGIDLMCTCPLDAPCHADVLLRIANESGGLNRTCTISEGPR
ncbi:DUF4326 domain-containing protein [Streptomyces sp. NPDC050546]|uniref:DUF4326 domain-containing protein n=1 Tax=Streptomyces sp. NPDC050546 TaxID=3365628 RepID=UPI003797A3BD